MLINSEIKIRKLSDSTYQVVEFSLSDVAIYEDETVLFQGTISECESYVRLNNSNLLI